MYLCVYARAQYKGSFCLFGFFFLTLVPSTLHTFTHTHTDRESCIWTHLGKWRLGEKLAHSWPCAPSAWWCNVARRKWTTMLRRNCCLKTNKQTKNTDTTCSTHLRGSFVPLLEEEEEDKGGDPLWCFFLRTWLVEFILFIFLIQWDEVQRVVTVCLQYLIAMSHPPHTHTHTFLKRWCHSINNKNEQQNLPGSPSVSFGATHTSMVRFNGLESGCWSVPGLFQ